jgi:predicted PurR-regulated permease PerM
MEKKNLDISTSVIIKVFAVILGLLLLYIIRDILALLFLSVILTATLDSPVDWMAKRKIPRPLGVLVIYLTLTIIIGLLVSFLIPPLINQFQNFAQNLPVYIEELSKTFNGITQYAQSYNIQFNANDFLMNSTGDIFKSSGQIFSTTIEVFSFFISVLVVLALAFYMLAKEDSMNKFLIFITPKNHHEHIVSIANGIKRKIGNWFAGQLLLMLIIFILDFIALSIFRVPYALILALLAGLLEIVPYLGPIISAVLASLIGFLVSPITGLIVLGILTIIQQIESNIIAPQLMKKVVGLDPIIVILSLLVGAKLGGVMGAVLAVPVATSISVIVRHFFDYRETEKPVSFQEDTI